MQLKNSMMESRLFEDGCTKKQKKAFKGATRLHSVNTRLMKPRSLKAMQQIT